MSDVRKKTQEDITKKNYHTFLDKLFKEEVTSDSLSLHYTLANPENYGIKNIKPTLGTLSIEQMKKDMIDAENNRKKLQEFKYDWLTKEDQITYEILNDVFSKKACLRCLPISYGTAWPNNWSASTVTNSFCGICLLLERRH